MSLYKLSVRVVKKEPAENGGEAREYKNFFIEAHSLARAVLDACDILHCRDYKSYEITLAMKEDGEVLPNDN